VGKRKEKSVNKSCRETICLDGSDWKIQGFVPGAGEKQGVYRAGASERGWIAARVPGNVQLDLFREKHPDRDIYYHDGVEEIQWAEHREWWYRKSFAVPGDWKGRELYLTFKGVDFRAVFWLNGKRLGEHIGMFTPVEFRVTEALKPGGRNVLAVQILPVPHGLPLKSRSEEYDWSIYVLTMGIWQEVYLTAVPAARIEGVWVDTASGKEGERAGVQLKVRIDNPSKSAYRLRARIFELGKKKAVASAELLPGRFKAEDRFEMETQIEHVKLWWPLGYGEQFLYEAVVTLEEVETGRPLDEFSTQFGVRTVKMLPNAGQKPDEEDWVLTVNGRRVYIKGMDWLPADQFYSQLDETAYYSLLERAAHLGCNMFRIWGGGLIEKDPFYDWCNRLGIMVIQEMIFANQYERVTDKTILGMVRTQIPRILRRVHNHPAIVMYNGGNEMPHYPEVREICERMDPSRPFYRDTGAHSPWTHQFPNDYRWWNRNRANLHGECCVSGCFNLETVERYIPKEDLVYPIPEPPLACEHVFKPVRAKRVRMEIFRVQRGLNARNDIVEIYNLNFKKFGGTLYGEGNSQYPVVDAIEVFTREGENVALASKGAKARASSSLEPGKVCHVGPHPPELIGGKPEHVIDGVYGNEYSWAGGKQNGPIQIGRAHV